ncbi:MAG TPA: hypothetical protein VHD83_04085 [Puia sp.]|nr:hypothetical protein [Puia sp.]
MHQDLKHRLLAWKNDVQPGEIKKVFIADNPITAGEDIVRLEISLSNRLTGKSSPLIMSGKFLTTRHLSSDIDHLNSVIVSLEKEFNHRHEQIFHEMDKTQLARCAELN